MSTQTAPGPHPPRSAGQDQGQRRARAHHELATVHRYHGHPPRKLVIGNASYVIQSWPTGLIDEDMARYW
ncbi:MAG TPA: hypothetical protein VNU46_01650 [Gemmatimonadaceae bacterium]|nr:hypothetical protein [Gemmatimonadaceae bacterium]